jgi:5-methylcytosine-specific restriction endonuclease McrA
MAMAGRALTVCTVPGCPNARPFADHPPRRGSTRAWRRLRLRVLRRDRFLCARCGALASEVDHVVPAKLGGVMIRGTCHAERHWRITPSR